MFLQLKRKHNQPTKRCVVCSKKSLRKEICYQWKECLMMWIMQLMQLLNLGLQFLQKHYKCSAFRNVQVLGWCSAGATLFSQCFVFRCSIGVPYSVAACSGVPVFMVYLSQRQSNIKNVLNYAFQIWKEDLMVLR